MRCYEIQFISHRTERTVYQKQSMHGQLIKVLEIHSLGIDNIVQLSNKAKSYYHIAIDDIGTCIVLGAQCNESE